MESLFTPSFKLSTDGSPLEAVQKMGARRRRRRGTRRRMTTTMTTTRRSGGGRAGGVKCLEESRKPQSYRIGRRLRSSSCRSVATAAYPTRTNGGGGRSGSSYEAGLLTCNQTTRRSSPVPGTVMSTSQVRAILHKSFANLMFSLCFRTLVTQGEAHQKVAGAIGLWKVLKAVS